MIRPARNGIAPNIGTPMLMHAGPPVRTNEPLPDAVGNKVRLWVPFDKSDGLTGTVKAFAAMGMAYVTMDNGSPERYIPVKYLVKIAT